MIKNNKLKLIISSAVILLPIIAGLVLWNTLPGQIAAHWDIGGSADGWNSKLSVVFAIPIFMLILHWICILVTAADSGNKDQNKKVFGMIFWICPFTSVFASTIIYATALGMKLNMGMIILISLGLMFILIGNYLPKCKQNYTIGIKVPWTLNYEENWNQTHRFGGKIWVIGGLLLAVTAFLPETFIPYILPLMLVSLAVIPVFYSYYYYRKQLKNGTAIEKRSIKSCNKRYNIISLILALIIILIAVFILFSGDIAVQCEETSFSIEATYWNDITINYSDIESIDYRESDTPGTRITGFGSPRLLMGKFQNDEFGTYTRYSYTGCDSCIVLKINGRTLVISGNDDENTKIIYDELRLAIA